MEFSMETGLSNIFKDILKSFYKVLQVISKWKTLKHPVYFLTAIEFWPTSHIEIDITLAMF